jgi:hypothetical protein
VANTARGHIEQLPSGSFRVHVYAGTDPVTGRQLRLRETCPDDATAAATCACHGTNASAGRNAAKYMQANNPMSRWPREYRPEA